MSKRDKKKSMDTNAWVCLFGESEQFSLDQKCFVLSPLCFHSNAAPDHCSIVQTRRLRLIFCFYILDLDQYVANHPFTGLGATVGGAQFAGTYGSLLLYFTIQIQQ